MAAYKAYKNNTYNYQPKKLQDGDQEFLFVCFPKLFYVFKQVYNEFFHNVVKGGKICYNTLKFILL